MSQRLTHLVNEQYAHDVVNHSGDVYEVCGHAQKVYAACRFVVDMTKTQPLPDGCATSSVDSKDGAAGGGSFPGLLARFPWRRLARVAYASSNRC